MQRSEVLQSFPDMSLCAVSACMHFYCRHISRPGTYSAPKRKPYLYKGIYITMLYAIWFWHGRRNRLVTTRERRASRCFGDGLATDLCTREGAVESTDHEP
jgi:hypothetical protein